jgi:DNA-binding MarR family transcriptional regulator
MNGEDSRIQIGVKTITWIAIIEQLSRTLVTRALKPLKIGYPEFGMLNHFSHGRPPEKTITGIAAAMQQTQPNATKTAQKLIAKKLIKASANAEDGRSRLLTMTEKGRAVHEEGLKLFVPLFAPALSDWSEDELAVFFRQLDRLKTYLDDNRQG